MEWLWLVKLDKVFQSRTIFESSTKYLSFMSFKGTENRNIADLYIRIWTSLLQNVVDGVLTFKLLHGVQIRNDEWKLTLIVSNDFNFARMKSVLSHVYITSI